MKSGGTLLATGKNEVGQLGEHSNALFPINPVSVKDAAGSVFGAVPGASP